MFLWKLCVLKCITFLIIFLFIQFVSHCVCVCVLSVLKIILFCFSKLYFICLHAHMCRHTWICACYVACVEVGNSLSFYHVDTWDWMQVVRIGNKLHYSLSCLTDIFVFIFKSGQSTRRKENSKKHSFVKKYLI